MKKYIYLTTTIINCLFIADGYASGGLRGSMIKKKAEQLGAGAPSAEAISNSPAPKLVKAMEVSAVKNQAEAAQRAAEAANTQEDYNAAKSGYDTAQERTGATDPIAQEALGSARKALAQAEERIRQRRAAQAAAAEAAETERTRAREAAEAAAAVARAREEAAAAAAADRAREEAAAADRTREEAAAAAAAAAAEEDTRRAAEATAAAAAEVRAREEAATAAAADRAREEAAAAAADRAREAAEAAAAEAERTRAREAAEAAAAEAERTRAREAAEAAAAETERTRAREAAAATAAAAEAAAASGSGASTSAGEAAAAAAERTRLAAVTGDMQNRFRIQQNRTVTGCRGGRCATGILASSINPNDYVRLGAGDLGGRATMLANVDAIFKPGMAAFIKPNMGSNLSRALREATGVNVDANMLKNIQAAVRGFRGNLFDDIIVPNTLISPTYLSSINARAYGDMLPEGAR